ncbi:hypothetical protein Bbelb_256790 [Branchiostoma belcheri]|nr:hypothetical protein Bbelb_256790 [Branchiostoma belcheri]
MKRLGGQARKWNVCVDTTAGHKRGLALRPCQPALPCRPRPDRLRRPALTTAYGPVKKHTVSLHQDSGQTPNLPQFGHQAKQDPEKVRHRNCEGRRWCKAYPVLLAASSGNELEPAASLTKTPCPHQLSHREFHNSSDGERNTTDRSACRVHHNRPKENPHHTNRVGLETVTTRPLLLLVIERDQHLRRDHPGLLKTAAWFGFTRPAQGPGGWYHVLGDVNREMISASPQSVHPYAVIGWQSAGRCNLRNFSGLGPTSFAFHGDKENRLSFDGFLIGNINRVRPGLARAEAGWSGARNFTHLVLMSPQAEKLTTVVSVVTPGYRWQDMCVLNAAIPELVQPPWRSACPAHLPRLSGRLTGHRQVHRSDSAHRTRSHM